MRVWVTSDLHIDYRRNKQFFQQLSVVDYQSDILIIAGDISHQLVEVIGLFRSLVRKFKKVLFVAGNHDLWVTPEDNVDYSWQKMQQLYHLAQQEGIVTTALTIGELYMVPLQSWYDFSFGHPSATIQRAWQDFKYCQWEESLEELTAKLIDQNIPSLSTTKTQVISFSHFLPMATLIPTQVPTIVKALLPVMGTQLLLPQIQQLESTIHIYGHSHLNRKVGVGNTVYINNAFGYPKEQHISRKRLLCIYADGQFLW